MSLSRRSRFAWTLGVAQVVISAPALAQVGAGVLTGKVVDATNQAPVPDVVVTVTSPALQGEQMVVTDASGSYRIPNLPPGEYTMRAEKDSFRPFSRGGLTMRVDATIRFDPLLLPEAIKGDEVVVQAQAPTVDVGSSNVGLNINREMMRRVPLSPPTGKGAGSKSFESVAAVAPGASSDMFGTSINGASSPENAYLIDGVSANSPTHGTLAVPLSYEFMGEVNVISAGYMPEYGRTTGGVVNAVTKSGGNEFRGAVWGDYTPGGLAASPKPAQYLSTIQLTRKVNNIWDIGFDVGGPIQKDKLWFYAGFQYARTVYDLRRTLNRLTPAPESAYQEIPGTETIYPATSKDYQAIGKLTYSMNQHHRLVLSLTVTPTRSGGLNGGREEFSISPDTGLPELAYLRGSAPQGTYSAMASQAKVDSYGTVLTYSADFDNKHVLWDTTAGWRNQFISNHAVDGSGPMDTRNPNVIAGTSFVQFTRNSPPHPITDFTNYERPFDTTLCAAPYSCNVPLYVAGGPGLALGLVDRYINRYQLKSVLTYFGEAAGHHVVKGGFDGELMTWRNVRGWPGARRYRERSNGSGFDDYRAYAYLRAPDEGVVVSHLDFTTKSLLVGGFVQDAWSVMDKVTVNIGGRYDAQFLYDPSGTVGLALPNQWSPRLGVMYDPTQSGRMKIFGNYARLYESVPLDIADRSLAGEPGAIATYTCDARDPAQLRDVCGSDAARQRWRGATTAGPDKKWQSAGAGLVPADPNIKPQSSDELVGGAQYEVIDNVRVGIDYTRRWINYVIEDMSRDEAQTYFLGNPGYGIATDFPKATRNYDAVTFSLHRAYSQHWQADFSYTLASLRGNISGLFRPESGQLDPNINSDFDLRSMMANRQGPLAGDRRHQIKAFGSYEFELPNDMRLNLGGVVTARSGDPSNYLGAHPAYGQNEAYLLPRGSGPRLPWMFSMDARAGYGIKIADTKMVELTVDVFNLFNLQAEVARDQTYTTSDVLPIEGGTESDLADKIKHASSNDPFLPGEKNASFGRPVAFQPPRYFKFGLRTTF